MNLSPPSQMWTSEVREGLGTDPNSTATARIMGFLSSLCIFKVLVTGISENVSREKKGEKKPSF